MSPTPEPRPGDQLLHCSPDRTVVRTVDPTSGKTILVKLFARGSLADAEQECALGQRLLALEVVRYLGAGLDAATGRPCLRMELHPGRDLAALVAMRGALHPAEACELMAKLARTLAAMHAMRGPDLPRGLVHGDVRLPNLLCHGNDLRLLDLEHGRAIRSDADAAEDVKGLGESLRLLLTGGHRNDSLRGHDAELRSLVAACGDAPLQRPTAAALATQLEALARRLQGDPAEVLLAEIHRGDLAEAARHAATLPHGPRRSELTALANQRSRLLEYRPQLLVPPPGGERADDRPAALLAGLQAAAAVLRRFPAHAPTLALRVELKARAGELLARIPELAADLRRNAEFEQAQGLCADAERMLLAAMTVPGPLRVPGASDPRMPTSLQRAPLAAMQRLLAELQAAESEHESLLATVTSAEGNLDLSAAEAAVERIASVYGGTTAVVARCRDRLHRLAFYLERIGRSRTGVERLGELLASAGRPVDTQPLLALLQDCAGRRLQVAPTAEAHAGMGLRSLLRALGDLSLEFESLAPRALQCRQILESTLDQATDLAWELIASANEKLAAVPVPVRPLQTVLHRLDSFRMLESLVDRPGRPRSQVLDRIEALRMKLDQARSTRDRLARGAELALSRGHWTTGLFEMERAASHLDPEGDEEEASEARLLRTRLDEARRRKQEIEAAVRRNMELARLYAGLVDDPNSTFDQRLRVLGERRDLLQFLAPRVQADRGELYGSDLRDVEAQVAQEQATQAEVAHDSLEDPAQRLQLARDTLGLLAGPAVGGSQGNEPPGRVLRLIDHWRKLAENAQRDLEKRQQEERARLFRRNRRRVLVAVASVMVAGLLTLASGVLQAGDRIAQEDERVALRLGTDHPAAAIAADIVAATALLVAAAQELQPPLAEPGARMAAMVNTVGRGDTPLTAILDQQHTAVLAFAEALAPLERSRGSSASGLRHFAERAWFTGLCLTAARTPADEREALLEHARSHRAELAPFGIALPAGWADELRSLR